MGLDMSLYSISKKITQNDSENIDYWELYEIHYWRKFVTLNTIMYNVWLKYKVVEHTDFDSDYLVITKDNLKEIITYIEPIKKSIDPWTEIKPFEEYKQSVLDLFNKLLEEFNFDNCTLLYDCSY